MVHASKRKKSLGELRPHLCSTLCSQEFFQQVNEVEKLKHFEEELLKTLASVLNQIHGQTLTTRCWRILLGNWLHRYITVFFNRYHTLANCLSQKRRKGRDFPQNWELQLSHPP